MSTGMIGHVEIEKLAASGICWHSFADGPHGATARIHYPFTTRDYCRDHIPHEYKAIADDLAAGHRLEVLQ